MYSYRRSVTTNDKFNAYTLAKNIITDVRIGRAEDLYSITFKAKTDTECKELGEVINKKLSTTFSDYEITSYSDSEYELRSNCHITIKPSQ